MTIKTYRNIRNLHKEIKVKHYDDGHYMWKQTMCFDNGVRNPIGTKKGGYRRCNKATINEVLEDYIEVIDVITTNIIRK